jgi:uncharacterized membrane protein
VDVEERLSAIERRLAIVENQVRPGFYASTAAATSRPASPTPPQRAGNPVRPPVVVRESKPGNWLGMIAVICFVLAAGFIIKLSIESGWLTPERQIGLAVLFGMGLIAAGLRLAGADREYAAFLPAAGVVVLYLAAFAAHRLYSLITFETALGVVGVVSGFCIWLYLEIKHDLYPLTAAVGAYVAPVILGINSGAEFTVYYFLLGSLAFATISIWVESRVLTMIAAYFAILMTAWVGLNLHGDKFIAVALALQALIFSFGTYLYTKQTNRPLNESESWSFLPVLLIFYAVEYHFLSRIQPGLAPWISLGFGAVLFGLYLSAKSMFPDRTLESQPMILAFIALVFFHSFYLELLPGDIRPWLFVAILFGLVFSPFEFTDTKADYRIPGLAVFAILAIEYVTMIFHLLAGKEPKWLAVSFAAFGTLWMALTQGREKFKKHEEYGNTLLGAAHLLAIIGFYRLTTDHGSLAVSASWLLYAVFVMAFAYQRKDRVMAKSALLVLSFAAAKALLYDASSAPTIVRILCLLLTGAVLYGSGFLMRRMSQWTKAPAAATAANVPPRRFN